MPNEYPLFPELPEPGRDEAQKLIDQFKAGLIKVADEVIGNLYCNEKRRLLHVRF